MVLGCRPTGRRTQPTGRPSQTAKPLRRRAVSKTRRDTNQRQPQDRNCQRPPCWRTSPFHRDCSQCCWSRWHGTLKSQRGRSVSPRRRSPSAEWPPGSLSAAFFMFSTRRQPRSVDSGGSQRRRLFERHSHPRRPPGGPSSSSSCCRSSRASRSYCFGGLLGVGLAAVFVLTGSLVVVIVAHYVINALEFVVHEGIGESGLS